MMNIKEWDVNLGVDSTCTKYSIRRRLLSSSSGAGVNADSRVNLAFPTSHPLSELVWSPNDGVSLKCADSNVDVSPLHTIRLKQSGDDPAVHQGNLRTLSQTLLLADDIIIGKEENCILDQEADSCHPQILQTDGIAETSQQIAAVVYLQSRSKEEIRAVAITPLKKLESSHLIELPRGNALPAATSSRNCFGEGKALSDGRWSESCNSARLSSEGKKRQIYDKGKVHGSKRMKKQIDASHRSTSNSSLMNWISNVRKFLACPSENFMFFRPQDSATTSMGFQTIDLAGSCDTNCNCGNSSQHMTFLCSKEVNNPIVPSKPCLLSSNVDQFLCPAESSLVKNNAYPDHIPVAMSDVLQESNHPLTSFWITRLSTKGKEIAEETSCTKADLHSGMNVVFPGDESTDSKFNASVLAKKEKFLTCSRICFFCGDCHDVRECPNVTKPELEDLLLKLSTLDRVEESSCLCIRCSRSDHWAISCPLVSQLYDGGGEDHKLVAADHTDCNSRKPLFKIFPTYQTWKFETKDVDNGQSDAATLQDTVARSSKIFNAIRNLQLTRADILRCMNSNVPSSHLNGFFLRVRLGKPEAGLGGSSYYVACITGDARKNDGRTSNKSISVDVGGIKSSVSSQYVSNHHFLEDEIKAWWCRIVDSGCRIPSLVELLSKFNDRKT